jgi:hypothetical protein
VLSRTGLQEHVGHFVALMGVLVPGVALTLAMPMVCADFHMA